MAILSSFYTRNWQITLNRVEASGESALVIGDFTISGNSVTSISGTGLTRNIVLGTAVEMLNPTHLMIVNHMTAPAMVVTSAVNADIPQFLEQIRQLLDIGLTSDDLPNSVVTNLVYLRKAEFQVYESTGLTDTTYDTKVGGLTPTPAQRIIAERYRISVMYRTAALLVPALPDVVEQSTLRLRTRYVEIDWQEKIALFIRLADDIIEDEIIDAQTATTVIAAVVTKTVSY